MSYRSITPLKVGLITLFIIVAMFAGYGAYTRSFDFFLSFNMAKIPGFAILATPTGSPNLDGTPASIAIPTPQSNDPSPIPWDGAGRVTILVMGLDYTDVRAAEDPGPPHTDTMILLTIDPLTKTAGMLNIPRDLWVNIPGYDYGKINTAYPLGIAYDDPSGGGPGLVKKTVEQLLGIPINYYAIIDFSAFEKFIDDLGGINVSVHQNMAVDPIGKGNTVFLKPKDYLFDGSTALAYARSRHTEGGDFDRAARQQQVILAIKDRIIELGPAEIAKRAGTMYNDISAGINTDLSLDDALKLGWLALSIPRDSIKQGAIAPPNAVMMAKSPDGTLDILIPVPDQVRLIRDQVFASTTMASPGLTSGDTRANMEAEGASIVVSNGSSAEGLAAKTQEYLQTQGAKVVGTQNSDYTTYTRLIDYTGKPYTDRYLVDLMGITKYSIELRYDPNSQVDVLVILGDDWAGNNPMP